MIFDNREKEVENKASVILKLDQFGPRILRKAGDRLDFYAFENLKKYFPAMNSFSEFILSASDIRVEISSSQSRLENLTPDDKLEIAVFVLDKLKSDIEKTWTEFRGTKIFQPIKIKEIVKDATINVVINDNITSDQERGIPMKESRNNELRLDLSGLSWYVYDENYGTSEEKYLIHFIKNMMKKLEEKYTDIYLLRNENLFKLYNFSNGRATEPDFVLFLKEKQTEKRSMYQLFIESKNEKLALSDKWKEDFLKEIETNCRTETFLENESFKIIGMPFYNEGTKSVFVDEFKNRLSLKIP
jgi:type III restriction enzyme